MAASRHLETDWRLSCQSADVAVLATVLVVREVWARHQPDIGCASESYLDDLTAPTVADIELEEIHDVWL